MSKATQKPDPYVVKRMADFTGLPSDKCAAALIEARYLWEPALTILRAEQGALKHIPVQDEPQKIHALMILTNGVQLREGMTPAEIDAANPYPRPTGNAVADRARRLAVKCAKVQHTPEQVARFERAHRSTYAEVAA